MINVLMIDDQTMLRTGMRLLLASLSKNYRMFEAANLETGLTILESDTQIHFVISEMKINNSIIPNIVELVKAVRPDVSTLFYSELSERLFALPVLRAGANGFIMKNTDPDELAKAIKIVSAGGRYLSLDLQASTVKKSSHHHIEDFQSVGRLSRRELTIMKELAMGKTTKEIAWGLSLKCNTVSTYKKRICLKMNVVDKIELSQKAMLFK